MNVKDLTKDEFEQEVIQSNLPVLVDFWAPWCAPCVMMAPALEELAEEMEGRIKICKLNIEIPENQELAYRYDIQSIPNMKLFKDGKVAKEFIGLRPKEVLQKELQAEI
jgi:thioredoxin 1